ncbi:TPA_asm: P overlapped [Medicago alphacytorhabdovirus 1]|nr:TPA_asm: P overlapped [Medicago alphacytorhabdovirus 1]
MRELLFDIYTYFVSLASRIFWTIWLSTHLTLMEKIFMMSAILWITLTTPLSILTTLLRLALRLR